MVTFCVNSNSYDDVKSCHMDICNLAEYEENSFDYAVKCQVTHELPAETQPRVISGLMRIGRKTVILDSNVPLP